MLKTSVLGFRCWVLAKGLLLLSGRDWGSNDLPDDVYFGIRHSVFDIHFYKMNAECRNTRHSLAARGFFLQMQDFSEVLKNGGITWLQMRDFSEILTFLVSLQNARSDFSGSNG